MNASTHRSSSGSALPAPPACPGPAAWALFLDFDGTLTDLAATPDSVVVTPRLRSVLAACAEALDGAVALVSGRPIAALDALLDPLRLPAAGLHGLERRLPDGAVEHAAPAHHGPGLSGLRARLEALVREDGRLLLEDKEASLALHFRRAPERERALRALVADAAPRHDGYEILHGKMVVEVKPAHANKGDAIAHYLKAPPFAGRRPVFAGDDVTPLRDGMNLVAKEYVAAQSPANPGVLVLSRFAGAAAQQADGALIVNPYDTQGVADALQTALNMPLAERKARWKKLVEGVRRDDVTAWRESFLERLYAGR